MFRIGDDAKTPEDLEYAVLDELLSDVLSAVEPYNTDMDTFQDGKLWSAAALVKEYKRRNKSVRSVS